MNTDTGELTYGMRKNAITKDAESAYSAYRGGFFIDWEEMQYAGHDLNADLAELERCLKEAETLETQFAKDTSEEGEYWHEEFKYLRESIEEDIGHVEGMIA